MKRKTPYFLLSIILIIATISNAQERRKIILDTNDMVLEWRAYKVLGSHHGSIALHSAIIEWEDMIISGGTFEVDMQSIKVKDLIGMEKDKLESHLKSKDFFDVGNHPIATYEISKREPVDRKTYRYLGNMTIKGICAPIICKAVIDSNTMVIESEINRSIFEVKYASGSFFDNLGDHMIYDLFEVKIIMDLNRLKNKNPQ